MDEKLSFDSIKPHLTTLRNFGFFQIELNNSKWKRYAHRAYMGFILFLGIMYTIQETMNVKEVIHDVDKVIDTMFLMLTYSVAIYKEVVLWTKQDNIEELLSILRGPLFNQNEPGHRELLLSRARQSRLLLRVFNGAALTTSFLWALFPAILYAKSKPVEFTIWLPFNSNMSPHFATKAYVSVATIIYDIVASMVYVTKINFYFALGYNWLQTSLLAMGNTSMDAFITFFFALCKTQLSILRLDLQNIVKKCQIESRETSTPLAKVFHSDFHKIIKHYDEIVNVCKKTEKIFGGVVLYMFLVEIGVICTSAYVMAQANPLSVQFSSMCLYLTCILTELYLFCHYGNEVTYECYDLISSVYSMDWHRVPQKERYNIIVFLERIKRPIVPMAGGFVPLSNTTFVSILRSSYSFYAFLRNSST